MPKYILASPHGHGTNRVELSGWPSAGDRLVNVVTDATREHEAAESDCFKYATYGGDSWPNIVRRRIAAWQRKPGRPSVTPENWHAIY